MARLTDPEVLARYKQALADWNFEGSIIFEGKQALDGLRTILEEDRRGFKEKLYTFVFQENGEIDQVKEDRERWRNIWEYHYDLRPTINGVKVYVETRLSPEDFSSRDDPVIIVVNIH